MKIKAGKYTLAVTMITAGILMMLYSASGVTFIRDFWMYSPAILILYGLEVIILNLVYSRREDVKISISIGSLFVILIVIAIFFAWTNKIEITGLGNELNITF